MKKILLVFVGGLFAVNMHAQISDAEADAMINLLGVQKREAISQLVSVTGKDSVSFWKLYDEYQKKNAVTAKQRLTLYQNTAMAYGNMSPRTADSLARRYFENRLSQEKSLEEYYSKIKMATNAVTAFEFFQAEVYILNQLRTQIMQQIPTYGQFSKATKKSN